MLTCKPRDKQVQKSGAFDRWEGMEIRKLLVHLGNYKYSGETELAESEALTPFVSHSKGSRLILKAM